MKSLNDYIYEKLVLNADFESLNIFLDETTWEKMRRSYVNFYLSHDAEKSIIEMFNKILEDKKLIIKGDDISSIKFPVIFAWDAGGTYIYHVIGEENGNIKQYSFWLELKDHESIYFIDDEDEFKNKDIYYVYDKYGHIGCYLIDDHDYKIVVDNVNYCIKDNIK